MEGETAKMDFASSIEELAASELADLDKRIRVLDGEMQILRDRRKSVRAVLSAITPSDRKPQKPKKNGSTGEKQWASFKMSDERLNEVLAFLKSLGDEEVTSRQIEDHFGWSNSYCSLTMRTLRDMGAIRLVRRDGSQMIYRTVLEA